ncbi:universal stress protein [Acetobacterium carbinolicum]|jgi:nucleotide-binding universal stress UspA family protein|uniref:universal stress protein n=1 Tax=Acetobacterium carbinolicum TaxID=52690 RepID=UPI0039C983C3
MFDKIIVVSEVSNASSEMVEYIRSLRSLGAKECLLLQCFNPQDVDAGVNSYLRSIFDENLKQQSAILIEQGFTVKTQIISGNIKHEINQIAEEDQYSLIVVGAEKHSIVSSLFLGGIAYNILYGAVKPILVIRDNNGKQTPEDNFNLIRHVLFPTDFSKNADVAFEQVKEMVRNGLKKVTIFHIQDESKINPYLLHRLVEFNEIDHDRLQKLKDELLTLNNVSVDIQIRFGSPTSEIIKLLNEEKIPLIVMGTQGRGFIKEIFLGSVSHNIVRHASASVLLIPGNRE